MTSRSTIHDALIIGGGPAGATAALMLARAGWSVALAFPRRKVCGEFISATSRPLLQELGLCGRYDALAGPPVRRVGLYADGTMLDAPMPQPSGAAAAWGRAIGREQFDTMLLDAAIEAGAVLWQPWTATSLRRVDYGYSCRIARRHDERTLDARIVIAAQGSWERGPLAIETSPAHRASDLIGFKAHFVGSRLPPDLMPLLVFPGGYGGMVHSDNDRVSLSCCVRRDALETSRQRYAGAGAGDAVLRHIKDSCRGVSEALDGAETKGPVLSAGPIRPGIRTRYSDGIFYVGNVAGEAHPIVAEGISMAIQSAWLLCQRLTRRNRLASPRLLADIGRAYTADWDESFVPRLRAAALFAAIASRPGAAALAVELLRRFPAILTFGAQLSGKTRHVVAA